LFVGFLCRRAGRRAWLPGYTRPLTCFHFGNAHTGNLSFSLSMGLHSTGPTVIEVSFGWGSFGCVLSSFQKACRVEGHATDHAHTLLTAPHARSHCAIGPRHHSSPPILSRLSSLHTVTLRELLLERQGDGTATVVGDSRRSGAGWLPRRRVDRGKAKEGGDAREGGGAEDALTKEGGGAEQGGGAGGVPGAGVARCLRKVIQ
jgi:hypothetical protein